jgi:Kef-type K+ transport system membrane component KefB
VLDLPLLTVLAQEAEEAKDPHEILLYLLLNLAIIIVAARFMGGVARRLGQPGVIGEVLAGILLGPTILGRIDADIPHELFPPEVPLRSIADLGLIFFMFLVGLELDARLLRAQGKRAVQISLSGVIAPLALGIMVGYLLYDVNLEGVFSPTEADVDMPSRFTFALFLGAAMCITAFPILARLLVETGLSKTPVGTATLAAAAVDDVTAWILLAAVVGIVQSGSPAEALPALGLTALFVIFMFFIGRRLLELLGKRYDAAGRLTIDQVAIIVVGLLLSAYATERIGIHAIFGAFIFGAMMPKRSGLTVQLTEKVEDFTVIVMLPVFFLVTGLRTDLFTLDSPSLLGYLLLILLAAILGKFAGCAIAARLTGSSTRDSVVVGALMNTRGLTELVILTIGLNLGVLSDRIFAMMVIMALFTTFMAPPIVNALYPRRERLRALAEAERAHLPQATRILVAVGSTQPAVGLVDLATMLTANRRPAEILLVHLIPPPRAPELRSGIHDEEVQTDLAVEGMRPLVEQAAGAGITARAFSFLSDDFGRDLARIAGDQRCEYVVMGWARASRPVEMVRILARRTFALAPCDVAVLYDPEGRGILPREEAPVLAILNGGSHDEAAAEAAAHMAQHLNTKLKLAGFAGKRAGADAALDSRTLALLADDIRNRTGVWTLPDFHSGDATDFAVEESREAITAFCGVSDDWVNGPEFGRTTENLARRILCPLTIVRGAAGVGAPSVERLPDGAREDWPFVTPVGARAAQPVISRLPGQPHLQRLDPYGDPVEVFIIGEGLNIGRSPENRLTLLEDNLVSRRHAAVERKNGRHVIQDLGSTNGTVLWRDKRWTPVSQAELRDGDLIVIGAHVFRYSQGDAGEEVTNGAN